MMRLFYHMYRSEQGVWDYANQTSTLEKEEEEAIRDEEGKRNVRW